MASYNGVLNEEIFVDTGWRNVSLNIQGMTSGQGMEIPPASIATFEPVSQGSYLFVENGANETAYDGGKVDSFLDDYYYRIHISPAIIEFGSIVSPSEETFIVWNAYFVSKTCSSIDKTVDTEYTLDPDVSPFSLMPLEYETYTVSVEVEGAVTFDATVTFVFTGESPVLILSGTRVAVFPFAPSIPMMES